MVPSLSFTGGSTGSSTISEHNFKKPGCGFIPRLCVVLNLCCVVCLCSVVLCVALYCCVVLFWRLVRQLSNVNQGVTKAGFNCEQCPMFPGIILRSNTRYVGTTGENKKKNTAKNQKGEGRGQENKS